MAASQDEHDAQKPLQPRLWLAGLLSLCLYAGLTAISFRFDTDTADPPILLAVALLGAATAIWLVALAVVMRRRELRDARTELGIILGFAVAYRLLLLPSAPIQEADYYRYLWDGRVTLSGHNPYHYSPYQIDSLAIVTVEPPDELAALGRLAEQPGSGRAIFERVHHRSVPTAYPPAAQAIFAFSAALTPADAPLWLHVLIWKSVLLAFDLGTLGLLVLLLRYLGLPQTWCLAYAWCPLALKEFANSGHFDAIAIFFTTLAVLALVNIGREHNKRRLQGMAILASVALALGILAKSYPVVLVPLLVAYLAKVLGWRTLAPVAVCLLVVAAGYSPFLGSAESIIDGPDQDLIQPNRVGAGLGTFLSQWEMNDFLFMLARENLKAPGVQDAPWFVVVPAGLRQALHDDAFVPLAVMARLSVQADIALVATQLLMGLLLLALCVRWAWQVFRNPEPAGLVRAVFLTLAWSWLLSAAQNPWYLLWCLPFMVFAGGRSWFLLPGLALLYYVRFWVETHSADGTGAVFDYQWIWLEYLPFFTALLLETWWKRRPIQESGQLLGELTLHGGLTPPARPLAQVGAIDGR